MVHRPLGNHHVRPDTLLVTSDATKETVPVAEESEPHRELSDAVAGLVRGARYVLFDFDGPICRLFAGRPATEIAQGQEEWLEAHGLGELLTEEDRSVQDPHAVLARLARQQPGSDLVQEMEKRLTEQELAAVPTAWPTPWADPLVRTWSAVGARLAITTNNSPEAVRRYLAGRELSVCFEPHIYGRTQDLNLLKPDPYCLNRALSAMGAAPGQALMIGDASSDCAAAAAAGVAFLGYARNEEKEKRLRKAGAGHVVYDLEPILKLLRQHP
ncbi:HAD family hydrolase [Streptomyces sp. cg35]|uniref:HAD family hydrolase n=1 Tax=Streptomyces sp. cg35 TaxID=3421650 RepID=UPI003D17449D